MSHAWPGPDGPAQPPSVPQPPSWSGGEHRPAMPAGHPTDAASTVTMPAVQDSAGYPATGGYNQSAYPPGEAYHPAATQGGYPPMTAQPYPAAQMSAPPLGTPMSGLPYGAPTPPAAAPGKGRTVLVLAIVAAVLFAIGGVMSGLFVAKSSELNSTERELRAQNAKLEASTKEIDRLKRDLEVANDKIDSVQQDLTGTKNDRDEIARQKQVISKCFDLLGKAATATTRSAYEKAIKEANKVCDEAEGYL